MNDDELNTENISIRIKPSQLLALIDEARRTDRTVAYIIRKLIDNNLKTQE